MNKEEGAKTTRCSRLPLLMACGQSHNTGDVTVNWPSQGGEIGTIVHAVLAGDDVEIPEELEREVNWLVATCRRYVDDHGIEIKQRELTVDGISAGLPFSGTIDVTGRAGDKALILDWKSGRGRGSHDAQLMGYAALGFQMSIKIDTLTCVQVFPRTEDHIVFEVTREEADAFVADVRKRLADPGEYSPGDHCQWCPRMIECPARREFLRGVCDVANIDMADPVVALERLKAVSRDVEKAIAQMKQDAERSPLIGERKIARVEVTQQERIALNAEAMEWLESMFGDGLAALLKTSKTALAGGLKVVFPGREHAGTRREQEKEMMDHFRNIGATVMTERRELIIEDKKEEE